MKKQLLSIMILSVCTFLNSSAQIAFQKVFTTNVPNNIEGRCAKQTSDGGYIIVGTTGSFGSGPKDVYVVKTDSIGNTIWTKTLGGTSYDEGHYVALTNDGGFIITGSITINNGAGDRDIFLVKFDSLGNKIWSNTYGGGGYEEGRSVEQTDDGGFIVTGFYDGVDIYLLKTDGVGNFIWGNRFGPANGQGYSVHQTNDGGYILSGYNDGFITGNSDACIIKTDSNGNLLWAKTYGGTGIESCNSIQQTIDSGYIMASYSTSYGAGGADFLLVKADSLGNFIWSKTFGGSANEVAYSIEQTNDGGFILSGYTQSFGAGLMDVYVVKTDANGNLLWSKTYGESSYDRGYSVAQTNDDGYIIGGEYSYLKGVYLIKTDNNGNGSNCTIGNPSSISTSPSLTFTNQNPPVTAAGIMTNAAFLFANGGSNCPLCDSVTANNPVANYTHQISGKNVQFYNSSINQQGFKWNFGDGTNSFINNPYHQYQTAGVFNACLLAFNFNNQCLLATTDTLCKLISINGIQDFFPTEISQTGTFIFDVTGAGFTTLTDFSLKKQGQNSIIADSLIIIDDNNLKALFYLDTAITTGYWTPHVAFANLDTFDLANGLLISAYEKPKLSINLSGNSRFRVGFNQVYNVTITNEGNVDAYFPLVLIGGLPTGTIFEVLSDSLLGGNDISTIDTLGIDYDSLSTSSLIDSITQTSFYMYQPYKVPAKGSITFGIIFHVPGTTPLGVNYQITAIVIRPMYSSISPEANQRMMMTVNWSDCLTSIVDLAITAALDLSGAQDWANCAQSLYGFSSSMYGVMKGLADSKNNSAIDDWLVMYDWSNVMLGTLESAHHCLSALGTSLPVGKVLKTAWKIYDKFNQVGGYAESAYSIKKDCFPPDTPEPPHVEDDRANLPITTASSSDPNIKTGPGISSNSHFITDDDELIYTIQFENDSTALLPAQTILVYDSLDMTKFDLGTFGFTNVTLGYKTRSINNLNSFMKQIDFSTEYGVNARISGQLDTLNGIISLIINSVDTSTNQITTNPILGVLPPDTVSPNGQGSFSFKIKLLPNVTNADTIKNSATIIFDSNAPIVTPIWQNIIDTIKPQSQLFVSSSLTSDDSVLVSFTGTDISSGIESFSIYVSFDSLIYFPWIPNTSDTSFYFYRDSTISTVYFISIAIDSAGNIENFPSTYDASTTFVTGINEYENGFEYVMIYPNPTDDKLNVSIQQRNQNGNTTISISDILGRTLINKEYSNSHNEIREQFDVSSLLSGIYLVEIKSGNGKVVKKFVKN